MKLYKILIIVSLAIILFGTVFATGSNTSGTITYYENGKFGEVVVYNHTEKVQSSNSENKIYFKELYIDYLRQCTSIWNYKDNINHHMAFRNDKNLDILNIGLGCGILAGTLAEDERVNKVDIVEINPDVIEASKYFDKSNQNLHSKPNVNIINADGFNYIKETNLTYDHVVIEINNPLVAYSSNLYTKESFSNIKKILNENGTLVIWPGNREPIKPGKYNKRYEYLNIIDNTLKEQFDNVFFSAYTNIFLASDSKIIHKNDNNQIKRRSFIINQKLRTDNNKEVNTIEHQPILKYLPVLNNTISEMKREARENIYNKVQEYKNNNKNYSYSKSLLLFSFIMFFIILLMPALFSNKISKLRQNKIITKFNILFALVLSAASSLLYEVTATELLFVYFTENSYSISTVLSVFLLGLSIGSFLIYKFFYKIKNKASLFMIFQFIIGLYALFVLKNLDLFLPQLSKLNLFIVSFTVLLVPTVFLGTTIPLINSLYGSIDNKKSKDRELGLVYGLDLVGAVIGTILSGFFLIPHIGIDFTILVGMLFNLFAGIFIIFISKEVNHSN